MILCTAKSKETEFKNCIYYRCRNIQSFLNRIYTVHTSTLGKKKNHKQHMYIFLHSIFCTKNCKHCHINIHVSMTMDGVITTYEANMDDNMFKEVKNNNALTLHTN